MSGLALVVGTAVLWGVGFAAGGALYFLVKRVVLSLIFLRRMHKGGVVFRKDVNVLQRFWYAFTFDADCVGADTGRVFFPGREWVD